MDKLFKANQGEGLSVNEQGNVYGEKRGLIRESINILECGELYVGLVITDCYSDRVQKKGLSLFLFHSQGTTPNFFVRMQKSEFINYT